MTATAFITVGDIALLAGVALALGIVIGYAIGLADINRIIRREGPRA